MNKILASAYNTVTRRLYLHTALVALFLLIVISITVWTGNTLTMITAIARFERTHTVSRVEAMAAFYDYQNDQNPETLKLFYSKMAITQSYNKVFSRLLDMRKDTPDAEAVRILESTFSETDHQTAVLIVNRIKVLHWHPILKELVADAVGAHAAGEALKVQVAQFLATNDKVQHQTILSEIKKTRHESIVYETSFSKSCSELSNQISSYVTYITIVLLILSFGFIGLLTYRIAKTVIQQMARDTLAVRESNALLSLFIHHSPIYAYIKEVTPTESRILQASENFEQMIGIKGSELVGKTTAEVFPADLAAKTLVDDLAVVAGGKTQEVEEELNGRTYSTLKFPIVQGGRTLLAGFTIDITERKQAEEEKLKLQAQLQHSQKMESLGTLAGGVAHDMNNVLGAILGLASAHIDNQPSGTPLHQALDTICKATERGGKMVKSLLSFARQSPAESHRLDMNGILKEQVALLERTTLAKVRLNMDLEAELRPIQGDASALTHAFMNLCVNAVDAMAENGMLTLHTRNVDNDWIEVEVEDNGMGMSKEVLEKAMDPFFTTKGTGKGTGLGLSMVFSTVKAHRGQMAIESQPDKGTRVLLRFPTCEHGTPVQAAAAAVVDATPPPHGALKVLLVDDDGLIQSSIQMLLEVLGHPAVTTAPSGEEALAVIEAGYEPDLVILDMNMPGLGGIGTLPRLRGLCPTVPILLSTGRVDQTALTLASTHPGVTLLSKPFGLKELQKHLESIGLG